MEVAKFDIGLIEYIVQSPKRNYTQKRLNMPPLHATSNHLAAICFATKPHAFSDGFHSQIIHKDAVFKES